MPELPDITVYLDALRVRVSDATLTRIDVVSPFVLRTAEPPLGALDGRRVVDLRRIGKRIAFGFDNDLWLVLHLMIAGRLQWADPGAKPRGRSVVARLHFDTGTLSFTEAGKKKRASMHVVDGARLDDIDPGGLEIADSDVDTFRARLTLRNHTLKRALTDPRLFSGIGNAYSDEILHAARLSPVRQTQKLDAEEIERLFEAVRTVLAQWTTRLRAETGDDFPARVTAFRDGMAVHGRYGEPCPVCETAVQRIRYADNELNYCPRCQTGGRLLADRALSRLLKKDWPRTIDELEVLRSSPPGVSG